MLNAKTNTNIEQGIMNKEVVQRYSSFLFPCSIQLFNIQKLFGRIVFFRRIVLLSGFQAFNKY